MPHKDPVKRREYSREYNRRRFREDEEFRKRHLGRVKINGARYNSERNMLIASFKESGCKICGEKARCCLSAHHVDPGSKDFAIALANGRGYSPSRLKSELEKFICVCENCHRKIHAGLIVI